MSTIPWWDYVLKEVLEILRGEGDPWPRLSTMMESLKNDEQVAFAVSDPPSDDQINEVATAMPITATEPATINVRREWVLMTPNICLRSAGLGQDRSSQTVMNATSMSQ